MYKTWNHFFVLRGLGVSKIFRIDTELRDKFHAISEHSWPNTHEFQRQHYKWEFASMGRSRLPVEYHFFELAIWDLRALVHEVHDISSCKSDPFIIVWSKLKDRLLAVINLNYDTIFDDSLSKGCDYFYPGESSDVKYRGNNDPDTIPIIRPHGSLGWTSVGTRSLSRLDWQWREEWKRTALQDLGYRQSESNPFHLDFRQSLIVSPVFVKEEIVGNSTMPGLGSAILKSQWTSLESVLRKSAKLKNKSHWVFLGLSLQSGDEYIITLLKQNYIEQQIHFSNYKCNRDIRNKLAEIFGEDKLCEHAYSAGTIDQFFSQAPNNCEFHNASNE